MQIQQKRRDVAILKTMGMSTRDLQKVFMRLGLRLSIFAATSGLGLAALTGIILENYPFIELPDVYYLSYLPARVEPALFLLVFASIVLLAFLAIWIPTRRIEQINITDTLRQE